MPVPLLVGAGFAALALGGVLGWALIVTTLYYNPFQMGTARVRNMLEVDYPEFTVEAVRSEAVDATRGPDGTASEPTRLYRYRLRHDDVPALMLDGSASFGLRGPITLPKDPDRILPEQIEALEYLDRVSRSRLLSEFLRLHPQVIVTNATTLPVGPPEAHRVAVRFDGRIPAGWTEQMGAVFGLEANGSWVRLGWEERRGEQTIDHGMAAVLRPSLTRR